MIKDTHLRILFIPLLGILLPYLAGIITYNYYTVGQLIAANVYFIITSFIIWIGCNWIHSRIRPLYGQGTDPLFKILTVCFASALYGTCIGSLSTLAWISVSGEPFAWDHVIRFVVICNVAVIGFTLVYEILFLNKEREQDTKIVGQMDRERSKAELQALHNEMDPHFIFNALTTLNHLIINDPPQAHVYNNKLAQVYKYFLINKKLELISLKNELEFIDDYFFMLQLRHDNKLKLDLRLDGQTGGNIMIPPCSLQILVENAIKHNEFSNQEPLHIAIEMNGKYLKVINNMKPKPYLVNSTQIGLKNLSARYQLICKKEIIIEQGTHTFTVKLPYIQ